MDDSIQVICCCFDQMLRMSKPFRHINVNVQSSLRLTNEEGAQGNPSGSPCHGMKARFVAIVKCFDKMSFQMSINFKITS